MSIISNRNIGSWCACKCMYNVLYRISDYVQGVWLHPSPLTILNSSSWPDFIFFMNIYHDKYDFDFEETDKRKKI